MSSSVTARTSGITSAVGVRQTHRRRGARRPVATFEVDAAYADGGPVAGRCRPCARSARQRRVLRHPLSLTPIQRRVGTWPTNSHRCRSSCVTLANRAILSPGRLGRTSNSVPAAQQPERRVLVRGLLSAITTGRLHVSRVLPPGRDVNVQMTLSITQRSPTCLVIGVNPRNSRQSRCPEPRARLARARRSRRAAASRLRRASGER